MKKTMQCGLCLMVRLLTTGLVGLIICRKDPSCGVTTHSGTTQTGFQESRITLETKIALRCEVGGLQLASGPIDGVQEEKHIMDGHSFVPYLLNL